MPAMEALFGRNRKVPRQGAQRRTQVQSITKAGLFALLILAAVAQPLAADYPQDFNRAFQFVKSWEGDHSDHPADRGGETTYGLSDRHDPPSSWSEAKRVYYEEYWVPSGAHRLSDALSFAVFDAAVQHGVPRARRMLRSVRHSETPVTDLLARRAIYYHDIIENDPSQAVFEKGWMRRLVAASRYAERLEVRHGDD